MQALPHNRQEALAGTTAALPVRVGLFGVERLVPRGCSDDLAHAWLHAPIGGLPLYRRVLEPLVGFGVRSFDLLGGRVAELLVDILRADPVFGLEARLGMLPMSGLADAVTVLLPGSGLLELDVRHLVRRMVRAPQTSEAHMFALGGEAHAHVLPPLGASGTPDWEVRLHTSRGRLHRVDTPDGLIAAARHAVDRRSAPWHVDGNWEADGLIGAGATISPLAELGLSAGMGNEVAVGSGSMVERCARIGPGAVVGRRSYVCEGAVVANAVILDDTFVPPWQHVRDAVRWQDRELT